LDLDAPRADEDASKQQSISGRDTKFPKTSMSVIGWAQSLTPMLKNLRQLERQARPCGDLRKTFGWPPDGE